MKKILLLAVAFIGLNASAQEQDLKKIHTEAQGSSLVITKELSNYLKIEDQETFDKVEKIITTRIQTAKINPGLSKKRLEVLDADMFASLKKALTEKQYSKLISKKEILDKITK